MTEKNLYSLISTIEEIKVNESQPDPLSRFSLEFVKAEKVVRVHARVGGGDNVARLSLLTAYPVATLHSGRADVVWSCSRNRHTCIVMWAVITNFGGRFDRAVVYTFHKFPRISVITNLWWAYTVTVHFTKL